MAELTVWHIPVCPFCQRLEILLTLKGVREAVRFEVTLVPGRAQSSFVFEPHWRERSWPPRDKYEDSATDAELGLIS